MIQDIAPRQFDNAYGRKRPAKKGDCILCFQKGKIYLKEAGETAAGFDFPRYEELFSEDCAAARGLYYLFSIDDIGYFLMDAPRFLERLNAADCAPTGKENADFYSTQIFRSMGEGDAVPLAMMTGLHLDTWLRKNRFCGRCGHETEEHPTERALLCPNCSNLIFPQIAPSVAVAIVDGDKLLLAQSVQNAQSGLRRFALIAGYVEIGETVEETVHREVLEEVGLRVKNLRYFKSQPWGLTGIEMLGYFVELDGSNQVTLQESELAEARWFTAEEIDWDMSLHSLSYTMIEEFRRNKGKKLQADGSEN